MTLSPESLVAETDSEVVCLLGYGATAENAVVLCISGGAGAAKAASPAHFND